MREMDPGLDKIEAHYVGTNILQYLHGTYK